MTIFNFFLTITMIISGWFMWKHCPKNINAIIGYRTKRSMKNEDTWRFAHEYCGRLWYYLGLGFILVALIFRTMNIAPDSGMYQYLYYVQLAAFFVAIWMTEQQLKKNFDKDGNRR